MVEVYRPFEDIIDGESMIVKVLRNRSEPEKFSGDEKQRLNNLYLMFPPSQRICNYLKSVSN